MGTIYLVRHGQCFDNAKHIIGPSRNSLLTPLGKKQAKAAGLKLKTAGLTALYSSPLRRAEQTAAIIAKVLGVKQVIIEADLVERNYGILAGVPNTKLSLKAKQILQHDGNNYFSGGYGTETFPQLYRRGKKILAKLMKAAAAGNIAVVTHGDIGLMIRAAFYGQTWRQAHEVPFGNGRIIKLKKI